MPSESLNSAQVAVAWYHVTPHPHWVQDSSERGLQAKPVLQARILKAVAFEPKDKFRQCGRAGSRCYTDSA